MILNELLYDPEYEPDMFEYELGCEREQAAEVFVYELNKYKRDRVQYKQTKKHPEKSKDIINRLKR